MKILIFGAAGSGTTTLGQAYAKTHGYKFIDVDDYYWLKTKIPFTKAREKEERVKMIKEVINQNENCVVSGAICPWGDSLISYFDVIVKLETPTELRISRLRTREKIRFGSRIEEGGDMHFNHNRFIEWASVYDDGDLDVRSNKLHNHWLQKIKDNANYQNKIKIIILDGSLNIQYLIKEIDK